MMKNFILLAVIGMLARYGYGKFQGKKQHLIESSGCA